MKVGNRTIRTHWLLDKKFQLRHTVFVVLLVSGSTLAFGYIVYLETYAFSLHQVMLAFSFVDTPDVNISLTYSILTYLTIFFIIIYAAVSWAFFYSHRIAGPSWKFKKVLHAIGQGRFDHTVVLRKGDHLKDLAGSFNEALKQMDGKARAQASMIRDMQNEIGNLIIILGSRNPEEASLRKTAKKLSDDLDRLSAMANHENTA